MSLLFEPISKSLIKPKMSTTQGEGNPKMFAGSDQNRRARSTGVIGGNVRGFDLRNLRSNYRLLTSSSIKKPISCVRHVSTCIRAKTGKPYRAFTHYTPFKVCTLADKLSIFMMLLSFITINISFIFIKTRAILEPSASAESVGIVTSIISDLVEAALEPSVGTESLDIATSIITDVVEVVLDASSGNEKDYRRELYNLKKNNKKDKFSSAQSIKPLHVVSNKKPSIPQMTIEELEEIMKKVPSNLVLDPSALIDWSIKDKFMKYVASWDINKVMVNKIMALFENISLLALNLYQAHTNSHVTSILIMWVKSTFASDKSLLLNMTELVCWFSRFKPKDLSSTMETLNSLWSDGMNFTGFTKGASKFDSTVVDPSAGTDAPVTFETVGTPGTDPSFASAYANCETIVRLKAMIQMFVDAGMCSIFGYSFDFSKGNGMLDWITTTTKSFEMVEFACSTIMYFIERGYAAYDRKNIKYLFFANDFVHAELEFRELENELKLMFNGDGSGDINAISDLEKKLVKLCAIYKKDYTRAKLSHRYVLSDRIGKINQCIHDIHTLQKKVGQRKAPYTIMFYGFSGVGKSWCTGTVVPSLLQSIGSPTDPYYIRTINQSDDYDTMIDNCTLAIQVDDIANGKPDFENKNPLDCVLRFVNNVMCPANKADLKDKGRVFISPLIVVVTTNKKCLNAGSYSVEPVSMLRRFDDHITVECDPKYMTDQKLDRSKWPEYNKRVGLPPITFTVETVMGIPNVVPDRPMHIKYTVAIWDKPDGSKVTMKGVDWSVLEPYLSFRAESKMAIQTTYLKDLKRTQNPIKCVCGVSYPYCSKHESAMNKYRTPFLRLIYHYRRNERLVCEYSDRSGRACDRGDKGRILKSCRWTKKFRLSNYTSQAFNAVLGLSGKPREVVWLDSRYHWLDDTRGNKNRKFRDVTIVQGADLPLQASSARLDSPLLVAESSIEVVPAPMAEVRDQVEEVDNSISDDTISFSDLIVGQDLHDLMGFPTARSFYDHDTDSDYGSLPSLDSDSGDVDSVESALEDMTEEERLAWQSNLDYENNLNALHPSSGEISQDMRESILTDWATLLDYWVYSKDMFRSMIDLEKFDLANRASLKLVKYGCSNYIPIKFYEQPQYIPGPDLPEFFESREMPRGEYQARIEAACAFRHSIMVLKQEVSRSEASSEESDDDDEEAMSTYERYCAILQFCSTGIMLLPFRYGYWLTNSTGSTVSGVITGFCTSVIMCVMSAVVCISIPSAIVACIMTILSCSFWSIWGVASYIGSTKWRLIKYITNFKEAHRKISHYSRKVLKGRYHLVFGAIAIMAVGTIWYRSRKKKEDELEPSGSEVSVPKPKINERSNNYWTVNKVDVASSFGVSGYQNTPEELLNTLETSLLRVRVYPPEVKSVLDSGGYTCQTTCAILMHGGLLVVPKHLVEGKMGCLIHAMRSEPGKIRNNADWFLNERDCYFIPNTDFAILYTSCLGSAKDISRFLPTKISRDSVRVKWLLKGKSSSGKFPISRGSAVMKFDNTTMVSSVGVFEGFNCSIVDEEGNNVESQNGWCMSPFVTASNPSCLHSFYLAGRGSVHRSAPFLVSYLNDAREYFSSNGKVLLPSSGDFSPPEDLSNIPNSRSPLSHLDKCDEQDVCFEYYGSRIGMARRFVGKVQNTPFASHLKSIFNCEWEWSSPINLGNWKPWWTNLFSMGVKVKPFDLDTLKIAEDDLRESLLKTCSEWRGVEGETFADVVFPVSMEVAINGVPGVAGCDRVKMNTSAGYPFCCSKSNVIDEVPDSSYPCGYRLEPNEEVKRHVDEIFNCANKDIRSNIVFTASVKDEPTLPTKEKVRVFAGCPVAYLICMRMMTSMLVKFMTDNHLAFSTVAGANAHDYDWTLIGKHLAEYSTTNCIAGDYSDYDKKILAMLMVMAVGLTCDMLRAAGYTDEMIAVCKNLMLESCFPIYEWNGDFINVCGSNPSGQPLTVWLNNLVNLLYQRYVFYKLYSKEEKFDDCVRILVMGDDNIMSVKPGYEKYNHTTIQEILGSLGMKYTMADKKAESVPYINLSEASLLKRSFVWSDDLECYLAPIEEKSIFRCLSSHMLANGDKSEAVVEHCGSMVENAMSEWFYFGEEVYNDRMVKMKKLLEVTNMHEFLPMILSYDDQVTAFKTRVVESRCLYGIKPNMQWYDSFVRVEPMKIGDLDPSGGFMGYQLVPEFGFREVLVGRKHETHVDYSTVFGSRRTLTIVDVYITSDLYSVPALFEQQCWIDTFDIVHLGIHHGSYFDDSDTRVKYRRGDWVLVEQNKRLREIYFGSLRPGVGEIESIWR